VINENNVELEEDSCFGAQVGALLSIDSLEELDVVAVKAAPEAVRNTILDTCRESQCDLDTARNVFRALPDLF
jgi:inulin fructotransferase (DFA-I-forming)